MFASGGEYLPWPLPASVITQTALETVFQVQNLSPVTVSSASTGYTYTVDGVSGGSVIAIDTSTNSGDAGPVPDQFAKRELACGCHRQPVTVSSPLEKGTANESPGRLYRLGLGRPTSRDAKGEAL
jgi:hypothetical protein